MTGLSYLLLGTKEQYLSIVNNPDLWHPRKGVALVFRSIHEGIDPFLDALNKISMEGECIILAHPLILAAAAIAQSLGKKCKIVALYLAPSNIRTIHDPWTIGPAKIPQWIPHSARKCIWKLIDSWIIDPAALPGLNSTRSNYHLPPVRNFIAHLHSVVDLYVSLFPEWFAKPQPDWPKPMFNGDFQLYEPWPDRTVSPELEQFLREGDPPIVFTPGSGNRHAQRYFEMAVAACEKLGRRGIFLTSYREQVPSQITRTILWQEFIPLRALLPRVAAFVHHGGIGTVAEALFSGTPQLILPLAHDQFDNAMRVQSLGCGEILITSRLRFQPFFSKLQGLLSSGEIAQRCSAVAENFRHNRRVDELCDVVESL